MDKLIRGRVLKFGDNIDTDIIAPGDVISFGMADAAEKELVKVSAFKVVRPEFYKAVKKGDILVAGRNFGFGSHREQATTVIEELGITTVIAESVARLYQRNSIAIGFPVFEAPGICSLVEEGEELEMDLTQWKVRNINTGAELNIEPYSEMVQKVLDAGGILEMMRKRLEGEGVPGQE